MQRLEVSVAVRPIYGSLGVKRLIRILVVYNVLRTCQTLVIGKIRKGNLKEWHIFKWILLLLLLYRVILSVLDPRKCEYLKDYSLHFEHAYMTTYLAS